MAVTLLNQNCCTQVNGYWTNGQITVQDGTNFTDTVGLGFAQSYGANTYCSQCPTSLKYNNGEITTSSSVLLTQKCCQNYNFNYDNTNSKCYTCPSSTQVTIGYEPGFDPLNIYPYGNVYLIEYLQIGGQNLSSACCQKYNQTENEGYYLPYSTTFGYVNPPDPSMPGYRCYKCPPSTEISGAAGFNFNGGDTILNGTYQELQFLNNSIKSSNCCLRVKLFSGFLTVFQNGKCYIETF